MDDEYVSPFPPSFPFITMARNAALKKSAVAVTSPDEQVELETFVVPNFTVKDLLSVIPCVAFFSRGRYSTDMTFTRLLTGRTASSALPFARARTSSRT